MSSDPQWAPDGTQPPELHTDPMLPAITDDMLPPLANPRVPTLDDRALAELLAELDGEDNTPLDQLDDLGLPARTRSTVDPLPASAARAPERSVGHRGAASVAAPAGADPIARPSDPLAAPGLAPDPTGLAAGDGGDVAAQVGLGAVPLPRPDPGNSGSSGPPSEPSPGRMSGPPPGTVPPPGTIPPTLGPASPPGQPLGPRTGRPRGQPFGAGAGLPPRPRVSQPLGAGPGRAPGGRAGAPGSRAGATGSRAGATGSPLGHSGVGPVIRSPYGDFRPPVARGSDVPTGLTGLTRKSRSKVGSVLFTVVFIAIFVLILIQALASVFTASAGH